MHTDGEFQVLLVDDEAEVRRSVRELLASSPRFHVAGEADGREAALRFLESRQVDVVFSDIQMDGGTGFELAEAIHKRHPDVLVVFLTGYASFALDGYLYGPVDFLVKPVSRERLEQTLERIRERLSRASLPAQSSQVGISTENGYRLAAPADIAYLEKDDRRVKIIWKDGSCDYTGKPMQEMEEVLLDWDFFRCHQSCLIPLRDIESVRKETFGRSYRILLRGLDRGLPLSRQKYYELRDLLRERGISLLT